MKNILILGSGYGLYGYLPALIELGFHSIKISLKYKEKIISRNDLSIYENYISWYENEKVALAKVDTIIIALNPSNQFKKVRECINFVNIENYILEKPLASNPANSKKLLFNLIKKEKKFIVGYNFRHTYWAKELFELNKSFNKIELTWNFKAHHFSNNIDTWKKDINKGGGIIRFYGIHLIALLVEMGYKKNLYSKTYGLRNKNYKWISEYKNESGSVFLIKINANSNKIFFNLVTYDNFSAKSKELINSSGPFYNIKYNNDINIDERVPYIKELINTINDKSKKISFHSDIIQLWEETEKNNKNIN